MGFHREVYSVTVNFGTVLISP